MSHGLQLEQDMVNSLIVALNHRFVSSIPSRTEARTTAELLGRAFPFEGNLNPIIERALTAITTKMEAGVSLIRPDTNHDSEWTRNRADIKWTYTNAYFKYLTSAEWSERMCQSLRNVSRTILGLLQNPVANGTWDRRGLVIGDVQSGKTANYLALISQAADAGYKFIIVIAGIQNVLRSQTQQRIDEGFVGLHSETKKPIGVGQSNEEIISEFPHPMTLTTVSDDFNKQIAKQSGWKLNDFSKPIILVIKKNVSVLNSLHGWLKDMNAQGGEQIETVPMLLIDDEADHASINTNNPDHDPTKTNQLIRKILNLFAKSSFVGYTATPFANIFIKPDDPDDLFPRDFIYCLDPPTSYFGPEKVFLKGSPDDLGSSRNQITVPITDCEDVLPLSHKKNDEISELPDSLCKAVNEFIIARAIRNLRGYEAHHCSMMINVSRFVKVQKNIYDLVGLYLRKLTNAVSANYAMPDPINVPHDDYMRELKDAHKEAYSHCNLSWEEIKTTLYDAVTSVRLFLINSKSDQKLDYRKYESNGNGLTAIAIGGLSLSRGLTIEGLCVSYTYRSTRMYDTLMQMGRWFGYRVGYEDLCRIHLSTDAISWYSYIANAALGLVAQVREMRLRDKTPRDFGLYVRSHPDQLLVTSRGKMQGGKKIHLQHNYGDRLQEFPILSLDASVNSRNEELIIDTWGDENLQRAKRPGQETSKGWIVRHVPTERVEKFLTQFTTHKALEYRKEGIIEYLRKKSDDYQTCDVVLVSISSRGERAEPLRLGAQERASDGQIKDDKWVLRGHRVASRGDEGLGLSKKQVQKAEKLANADQRLKSLSDRYYRKVRKRPLLMIHVLTGETGLSLENHRIPTIGMSFPPDNYTTKVEIVANPIYIQQELFAFHGPEESSLGIDED